MKITYPTFGRIGFKALPVHDYTLCIDDVTQRHCVRGDLEVEMMKTCSVQAFNWLLRSVTQATCLHDLMWYFVAALTPLPADMDESAAPPEKKEKKDPDLVCNVM